MEPVKIAAVIAEYNPFHNGHLYQLRTIREQLGADHIIVVLGGDFLQRGIPAIMDKYERCRMALENGADVVFELPVYFALGSAEYFAGGAVSLADKLGVVDYLHFGSECGRVEELAACAKMLSKETDAYKKALNTALKRGNPFPAARAFAMNAVRHHDSSPADSGTLPGQETYACRNAEPVSAPNNILGVEYIKALIKRSSSITPVTICRNGGDYSSSSLIRGMPASAHAIREHLANMQELPALREFVPDNVYKSLYAAWQLHSFVFADDFSQLLRYKLLGELQHSSNALSCYYDVTEQLANTFANAIRLFTTFSEYALACKSKNLTYSRISRCLMHILLDLRQDTADALKASDYCLYARLLGFHARGRDLLGYMKKNAAIPIITKLPDALKKLDGIARTSLKADIHASTVYQSVRSGNKPFPNELTRGIVKPG